MGVVEACWEIEEALDFMITDVGMKNNVGNERLGRCKSNKFCR